MIIGLDFDNTIICYDLIFHRVASEQGLIPSDVPARKEQVRDYLRRCGREKDWTGLQGYVYGKRIREAEPFPGALEFLSRSKRQNVDVFIISHKTRFPFEGPAYDLHAAALAWLDGVGLFDQDRYGLCEHRVFFEPTKKRKLIRIAEIGCEYFVDDLPEFLAEPEFPQGISRILFDPTRRKVGLRELTPAGSWREIEEIVFQQDRP